MNMNVMGHFNAMNFGQITGKLLLMLLNDTFFYNELLIVDVS
jgi:hypothetical protein